ncbi:MAG: MsnO8 family LLM class oxidoreductase, partial [Propionibacteriaceae bacterium]|nr:MsnO8 family LLM class oxidoreductase [Propionibacteriaceae bacterium]
QDTHQIRLGSGGVMLPNHAPLAVAEQFALLTAVYGDRIDLGIGRAPGTDPITSAAIRGHLGGGHFVDADGRPVDPVREFPRNVQDILTLLSPGGAEIRMPHGRNYHLRAAPDIQHSPQVWLLGSSDYSAQLAAALGLPYVFAHHFSGRGTQQALDLYRGSFQPTEYGEQPRTFLSMNVCVAETSDEAWELVEPHLYTMTKFLTGGGLTPAPFVGDDVKRLFTDDLRAAGQASVDTWAVGDPEEVAHQLRETAAELGVDEIMIHPVQGAYESDPADAWPAKIRGFELLAEQFLAGEGAS